MAAEARKTVTVVFSDVTGSTSLGEQLDPEALRRVMERYFEEMRAVLERHGGTVEKFIGDAVMAVFGIPELHEDDALRAVRAAAEMREALAVLNGELERERGVVLAVRTGVNTGEVVAGDPAGGQFYATGDAVNVAARFEQAAAPGEILLGEQTRRLVKDAVQLEAVDPLALKGKTDVVTAWRLVEVLEGAAGFSRRFDAPFVGRDRELTRLREAYERARDERACRMCTVIAAAGVGKSRLASELAASVEEEGTVLVGRCLSYGEGITYWPLAEIVKELERRPETAAFVDERVAAAVGLAEGPTSTDETFLVVRKLIETLAQERPLVVVLDDFHWAEPTLLDLVEHVVDWSTHAPIFFLTLARPDLLEERPSWATERDNATVVRLEPLSHTEGDALIDNLAGANLPEALRRRILDAAEGNPLFVEQMLAMLAENDHGDGHGEAVVPPTIKALLAARLDRLPSEERSVIEPAAVTGKEFWLGALVALTPEDAAVSAKLQHLVRKELIRPDRSTLSGEDAFSFRHVLIRDAAYAGIPKERRSDLHERFAGWLEERTPEYEEIVGYHLEQAFRYRKELGQIDQAGRDLARRAVERLATAGRKATARGDMPAAVNLLERAADLLGEEEQLRLELLLELAAAMMEAGDLSRAGEIVEEAVAEAKAANDRRQELRALVQREALLYLTDPEQAEESNSRVAAMVIPEFEEVGDDLGLAMAWQLRCYVHWTACRFGEAVQALERALAHAERAGDRFRKRKILSDIATGLGVGPLPIPEAIKRCEDLRAGVEGDPVLDSELAGELARLEAMRGRFERGRELYEGGEALLAELGHKLALGHVHGQAGAVETLAGNLPAAEQKLRASCEIFTEMGEKGYLSTHAAELAQVLYARGSFDEAERFAELSAETASSGDVVSQARLRGVRAKLCAKRGDIEQAEQLASEAVALAQPTDYPLLQGDMLMALAEVLRLAEHTREAMTAAEQARVAYERKAILVLAERARRLLAELREGHGDRG